MSSIISDLKYFSIDFLDLPQVALMNFRVEYFPLYKVPPYEFIRGKVVLPRKGNIMSRDQSERSKRSRKQAQKFNCTFFSHNYDNYSMFRDVPECSGMFRDVPCSGFYRRPLLPTLFVYEFGTNSTVTSAVRSKRPSVPRTNHISTMYFLR